MIEYHKKNILTHIVDDNSLTSKASSLHGCINVASYMGAGLKVCYTISGNNIILKAILTTPLGDHEIGRATIDPKKPTVKIGGSFHGFTAEVKITFDFKTYELKLCSKICVPFAGCKSGCVSVHI
jgi:hypothetical protein